MIVASQARLHSLDGLRAVSVLLVLLGHLAHTTGAPAWLSASEPYANVGVRIFFVISGFLITHLLMREHERTGTIDLRGFYLRRFFRIFPAAYAFMIVAAMVWWQTLTRSDLLTAFAYLSNYHPNRPWELGHLWSLAVEEQFYLLWPAALVLWYRQRELLAAGTILLAPAVRAVLFATHRPIAAYEWFPALADALATGCLLALARHKLDRFGRILGSRAFLVIPALLVLLVQFGQTRWLGRATNAIYWIAIVPVIHLGIALTIDHALRRRYWLLNVAPMAWLGTLSYSIYLWQQPFLAPSSPLAWRSFPLNVALALGMSCASYYGIERPALRYRERQAKRLKPTPGSAAPTSSLQG